MNWLNQMTGTNLAILGIIILGLGGLIISIDGSPASDAIKILGGFIGGLVAAKAGDHA